MVKYFSSDASAQARHLLDGSTVGSYVIECDWLNSAHINFSSLHAKALYIDCLPPNYRDLREFKKMFCKVKTPIYCQVSGKRLFSQRYINKKG